MVRAPGCAKPLQGCSPCHPSASARGHLSQEALLPSDLLLCPSPGRPRTLRLGHRGHGAQPQAQPKPRTHASTPPACGPHHRRTHRTYGPWAHPPCPAVTRSRGVSAPRPQSPAGLHPAPAFSPGGSRLGGGRVRLGRGKGPTLPQVRPYPEGLHWSGWRQNLSSPTQAGPSCSFSPVQEGRVRATARQGPSPPAPAQLPTDIGTLQPLHKFIGRRPCHLQDLFQLVQVSAELRSTAWAREQG